MPLPTDAHTHLEQQHLASPAPALHAVYTAAQLLTAHLCRPDVSLSRAVAVSGSGLPNMTGSSALRQKEAPPTEAGPGLFHVLQAERDAATSEKRLSEGEARAPALAGGPIGLG